MIFYYTPGTCSLASNIALEEAGAPYEAQMIRLWKPGEVEAFRQINPGRTIPALRVDEVIFTENTAILYYVARTFPDAGLLPEDPLGQALCLSKLAWFSSSVHITRRMNKAPFRFTDDEAVQAGLTKAGAPAFWENMGRIDAMYAGQDWLVGDRMTIADCYALLFYDWAVRDEFDMASLPSFTALKDRMLERAAVRRALERHRSPLLPDRGK